MFAHMVVNREVFAFYKVVTIKFHLLTRDAGTLLNSSSSIFAVSQLQALNFVKRLSLCSDCSIKNLLYHSDEVLTVCNKVGFTLHSNHRSKAINSLYKHATI